MRVTLLHIATDGNAEIPRALRQECDDIVQISASQLRPFAELISGAEPPRRDERDGGMLAIHAGLERQRRTATVMRTAGRCSAASPSTRPNGRRKTGRTSSGSRSPRTTRSPTTATSRTTGRSTTTGPARTTARRSPRSPRSPTTELPPRRRALHSRLHARAGREPGRPEFTARAEAPARKDAQLRLESPELPPREELYAAPVAVPPVAEELTAERAPARLRPEPDVLRPVESGYSPGGVRDQFQLEAPAREPSFAADAGDRYQLSPVPVPVGAGTGTAAIRRLPVHNGAQSAQPTGQPSSGPMPLGPGPSGPGPLGQRPQSQGPAGPANPDLGAGPSSLPSGPGSGGQPIAPVVPMEQPGQGYGGNRGPAYGGPRPVTGPVSLVGQPPAAPAPGAYAGPAGPAGQAGPGDGGSGQPGRPGQPGQPGSDAYPALSQVAPPPSAAQQDAGGSPGYPPAGSPASPSPTRCSPRTRRARRSASRWPATRPRSGWKPCLPGSPGCRLTLRPGCFRDRPCRSTSCSMTRCGTRCAAGSGMRLSTPADKSGRMEKGR